MKLRFVLSLVTAFILTTTNAQVSKFAGKYAINKVKTQFGDAPEWTLPRFLTVSIGNGAIIIGRVRLDVNLVEQPSTVDTIPLNSTPFIQNLPSRERVESIYTPVNDLSFRLERRLSVPGDQGKFSIATEVWTLEDNGKVLSVLRDVEQANGKKYRIHAFFDRK